MLSLLFNDYPLTDKKKYLCSYFVLIAIFTKCCIARCMIHNMYYALGGKMVCELLLTRTDEAERRDL